MKKKKKKQYVLGVDGGGFKTEAALADLGGKIKKIAFSGSSNLRNSGIKTSAENIAKAVEKVLSKDQKNEEIVSTYIGLASIEEEFNLRKKDLQAELKKHKEISSIFQGKVKIGSDQAAAFFAGTDKEEGIVLIAGTGSVAHGWKKGKEAKVGGWGWLNDEGSGFWTGKQGFEALFKDLDGRGEKTLITDLLFKEWKLKKKEDLLKKAYTQEAITTISLISKIIDKAAEKGDKTASLILEQAGQELAQMANCLIKKLDFQKQAFPLIFVGGMFKSKIVLNVTKKEIKKFSPQVKFIKLQKKPVVGAVKLAIRALKTEK